MTRSVDRSHDFHFSCHRCGNCCRVGHGQVWFEQEDLPAMAQLLDMTVESFTRRFVRQVDGRLSLREDPDGSCMMLDGQEHCSIYEHRPEQCRTFPFWPKLEDSQAELEEAAAYCPGIQRFPEEEVVALVLTQTAQLLEAALGKQSSRSNPGTSSSPDGDRWGSSLEVDLYLATATERRIHHADLLQALRHDLENLATRSGYPWSVAPWERLLADRRAGWMARGGLPTLA
ncbi:MAG: YkgJ family cysteine cluster protein [Planctomycetota bacterium]|jgi:Fe-S-cluster containining protein